MKSRAWKFEIALPRSNPLEKTEAKVAPQTRLTGTSSSSTGMRRRISFQMGRRNGTERAATRRTSLKVRRSSAPPLPSRSSDAPRLSESEDTFPF